MIISYPSSGPVQTRLPRPPYRPRLKWGLGWGFVYAAAASLWAIAVALLQRRIFFPEFGDEGMTLWLILVSYWVAGSVAGLALGLLYRLAERRWSAFLLGCILGFVAYGTIGIAMLGIRPLTFGIAAIPAVIGGGGLGLVSFDDERKNSSEALIRASK